MSVEFKEVIFILEAGGLIGLGHLNRCNAIASRLKLSYNAKISFLIVSQKEFFFDYPHVFYKDLNDAIIKAKTLQNVRLVIDTYNLSVETIDQLNQFNNEIYLIDDLITNPCRGINIINPSLVDNSDRYNLIQNRVLSGNQFILLRDGIKKRLTPSSVSNVFLYMGGFIELSTISYVINTIVNQFPFLEINVVLSTNINDLERKSLMRSSSNIKLHNNLRSKEISELIELCTFGIIAAGQIIHEFIYLSKPFIAIYSANNQKNNIIALNKIHEELIVIELAQIKHKILEGILSMVNFDYRQKVIESFQGLIDGRGSQRVADFIMDNYND